MGNLYLLRDPREAGSPLDKLKEGLVDAIDKDLLKLPAIGDKLGYLKKFKEDVIDRRINERNIGARYGRGSPDFVKAIRRSRNAILKGIYPVSINEWVTLLLIPGPLFDKHFAAFEGEVEYVIWFVENGLSLP